MAVIHHYAQLPTLPTSCFGFRESKFPTIERNRDSVFCATTSEALETTLSQGHHLSHYEARTLLVQSCNKSNNLPEALQTHQNILKLGFIPDIFVENNIINMYIRCGSLKYALHVFENMSQHNVFSFTLLLSGYEKYDYQDESMKLFWRMIEEGINVDNVAIVSVIKACTSASNLEQGKQVHCYMVMCGIKFNSFVFNALIDMYSKCGSIGDAIYVFNRVEEREVVSWNSIISGCVQNEHHTSALGFFKEMEKEDFKPDPITLVCVLKSCASLLDVDYGVKIHVSILELGYESNTYIGSTLVDFYSKSGDMDTACRIFHRMLERDVVAWNALISGYASHGYVDNALRAYEGLKQYGVEPDEISFLNVLNALEGPALLEEGKTIHAHSIEDGKEMDTTVGNSLLDMYGKCGSLDDAAIMFRRLPDRNTVSWNMMITKYCNEECCKEAIELFENMSMEHVKPDEVTFINVLCACSMSGDIKKGQDVHTQVVHSGFESSLQLGNTIIDMYSKNGSLEDALHIFNTLTDTDVVSWNAMTTGYIQSGQGSVALLKLQEMEQQGIRPNMVSLINGLIASADLSSLEDGLKFHSYAVKAAYDMDAFVGCTIVDMYVKCHCLEDARCVFYQVPQSSPALNTLIAGYGANGDIEEALHLFYIMQAEQMMLDEYTFISILNACADSCALEEGKCIYSQFVKVGYDLNIYIASSLADMYAKSGQVDDARYVFDESPERDLFLWTVMITGYAQHGHEKELFELWDKLLEAGIKPDGNIYVSLISACSHIGLIDKGIQLLNMMTRQHNLIPSVEHFTCFVDLFGRAGRLNEAVQFISELPVQPDASVWRTLLGACRNHGYLELAEFASSNLRKLEPEDSSAYVFLSNTYAAVGDANS